MLVTTANRILPTVLTDAADAAAGHLVFMRVFTMRPRSFCGPAYHCGQASECRPACKIMACLNHSDSCLWHGSSRRSARSTASAIAVATLNTCQAATTATGEAGISANSFPMIDKTNQWDKYSV